MAHNTEGRESDGTYFFAVKDPQGCVNHTAVAMDEDYAVEQFLNIESAMNDLCNAFKTVKGLQTRCGKSWEQYEAEGFKIVTIRLVECDV